MLEMQWPPDNYYSWKKNRTAKFLSKKGFRIKDVKQLAALPSSKIVGLDDIVLTVVRDIEGGFEAIHLDEQSEPYYEENRLSGLKSYPSQVYRSDVSTYGKLRVTNERWFSRASHFPWVVQDYQLKEGIYVLTDQIFIKRIYTVLADPNMRMGKVKGVK